MTDDQSGKWFWIGRVPIQRCDGPAVKDRFNLAQQSMKSVGIEIESLSSHARIFLVDRMALSQTLPMLVAVGGLKCHVIPCRRNLDSMVVWSIS